MREVRKSGRPKNEVRRERDYDIALVKIQNQEVMGLGNGVIVLGTRCLYFDMPLDLIERLPWKLNHE